MRFHPPFLKEIVLKRPDKPTNQFPFSIPAFSVGLRLELSKPITFFVGENGTGKSTLLEGMAQKIGLNTGGGSQNHFFEAPTGASNSSILEHLQFSWLPKVSKGFFLRAESFFDFASYIDELSRFDPTIFMGYGGKSLHSQSHGEAFLSFFENQIGKSGVFLLDEPEAALSPSRQLSLLTILNKMEKTGLAQFVIATHSPILMSYPNSEILSFDGGQVASIKYEETEHYKLTKAFLDSPERYFRHLFTD